MLRLGFSIIVAFFPIVTFSQKVSVKDTIQDSIKVHSVKKAIVLSSCLPGAGQIYNHLAMPKGKKKAFWKVPLIYAGLGGTAYFMIQNQFTQVSIKNEYSNRLTGGTLNPKWEQYDNQALLTLHRQYLDNRDLSMLLFIAFYGLQIADAGVEAHFVKFDVSDDISLFLKPKMLYTNSIGLSLQFKIH